MLLVLPSDVGPESGLAAGEPKMADPVESFLFFVKSYWFSTATCCRRCQSGPRRPSSGSCSVSVTASWAAGGTAPASTGISARRWSSSCAASSPMPVPKGRTDALRALAEEKHNDRSTTADRIRRSPALFVGSAPGSPRFAQSSPHCRLSSRLGDAVFLSPDMIAWSIIRP